MDINRRNFFGVAAGGAVATPVIAKEAAQKMGLKQEIPYYYDNGTAEAIDTVREGPSKPKTMEWAREVWKKLDSQKSKDRRHSEARRLAHKFLDVDLATQKSLSPASAIQIQAKRNYIRLTEEAKHDTVREIGYAGLDVSSWIS